MALIEGGIRDRLIFESCHRMIHDALNQLGWFGQLGTPARPIPPIVWRTERYDDDQRIPVNALVVSSEDTNSADLEVGSLLSEDATQFWVDFYPVDDELGKHVMGDVRAILQGKMASANRVEPGFWVTDHRPNAPVPGADLFWVEIEDVQSLHSVRQSSTPEVQLQRSVSFDVVDEVD